MDIAVKYQFFKALCGGDDPEAESLYRWHIEARSGARMNAGLATDQWKRSVDNYVEAARELFASMKLEGFKIGFPVMIDPDGEILNGSHRVACALALGIGEVAVLPCQRHVWAPAWDADWFREAGMAEDRVDELSACLRQLTT